MISESQNQKLMKQLNSLQNAVYLIGALLMVVGAGSSMLAWKYAPYVFAVGALAFVSMQFLQRYEGRQQEKKITDKHHPTQTADDNVRALIALKELHGDKGKCPNGKDVWCKLPRQHARTCPHDHQQGTDQINGILDTIQLFHDLRVLALADHH